mgnify:CR=1 FL=1
MQAALQLNRTGMRDDSSSDQLTEWLTAVGRDRSKTAFQSLFEHFAPRLRSFMRTQGASEAVADDLVQETIYKALKSADKLRDVATIDAWLYRILYNCWQDYLRVKGRNVEFVEMHDSEQADQSESYQQSQIVKRVRSSIEKLPMPLREVVTLADFSGLSYAEIADVTNVPIGTVMSRLFRARQNLKQELLEFGSDNLSELVLRRVK